MITIDETLVKRLVAAEFPAWADLPVTPVVPGGHDNRTFHLGAERTARLPSAACYAAQAEKEWRWLRLLQPGLPLPIPVPLALGEPGEGFPWHWTICPWLGETASAQGISDKIQFARDLAAFLRALEAIGAAEGPPAGEHNFYRGGDLMVYDAEARKAIQATRGLLPHETGTLFALWDRARSSTWAGRPVWVHGDVAITNLLARDGRLSGVLDFGCLAVGDPACDLVMAWTFFTGESRAAFRRAMDLPSDAWDRARGWALWKALITLEATRDAEVRREAVRVIDEIMIDAESFHS